MGQASSIIGGVIGLMRMVRKKRLEYAKIQSTMQYSQIGWSVQTRDINIVCIKRRLHEAFRQRQFCDAERWIKFVAVHNKNCN